jgi:hypothetical protein
MNKHTPAPWIITNGRCIYGNGDLIKPFVASVEDDHNDSETAANARLIVSAPDLLAAMDGLLEYLQGYDTDYPEAAPVFEKARAAITKATGDAQ